MKLSELPPEKNLQDVKIKLTPELKEAYADYSSNGEEEVYLVGECMGDWFISPIAPTEEKRALYPMPLTVQPIDFLECEIITEQNG